MQEQTYKLYSYRWIVLITYMLLQACMQIAWATFFAFTTEAATYYGFTDEAEGVAAISLFSTMFMVGMVVLSIPSFWAFEKFGFKKSVAFGAILMSVAGILRGIFGDSYGLVFVCELLFAIAQPFVLNAVGLVPAKWFPEKQRGMANGLAMLSSYIGIIIGMMIAPTFITMGMSIKQILWMYGIVFAVCTILFLILAKEEPPTPPCAPEESVRESFMDGMKSAFKKPDFIKALLLYFIVMGIMNTITTVIEPVLKYVCGDAISISQIGVIGSMIFVMCVIGSFILPSVSDRDHQKRKKYIIISLIIGTIAFAMFMVVSSYAGAMAAAIVYGLFGMGSMPVILTYIAEVGRPTSEGTSEGLCLFAGNVAGVIFLQIFNMFHGNYGAGMITMIAVAIVSVIISFTIKDVKRS